MIYTAYAEQTAQVCGIRLVSCGHIFAQQGRQIDRPNGRDDWLLFYIAKGSETFYLDSVQTGKQGSFVLFAPHEKQQHIYQGEETGEFYYVHFQCKALPEDISLSTSQVYHTRFQRQICDVFEEMIEETLKKQPLYEKMCIYKLLHLFASLERELIRDGSADQENVDRIARVVQHMNRSYNSDLSLEAYADMCAMSKHHFLRVFKKAVGVTPLEYRNNIRMQHAADLIAEETMTIEQISSLLGFTSASYFSTAFKRKYGISPKQYQKRI